MQLSHHHFFFLSDVRVPRKAYGRFFLGWRPSTNAVYSCKSAFRTFQKNAIGRTWGTASRKVVENVCSMVEDYNEAAPKYKNSTTQV